MGCCTAVSLNGGFLFLVALFLPEACLAMSGVPRRSLSRPLNPGASGVPFLAAWCVSWPVA